MQLLTWLQGLSENDLRELFRELLVKMGYSRVAIVHGARESGRDIVFFEQDRLGRSIWRGVQVKAQKMTGRVGHPSFAREVVQQCDMSLDTPYLDVTDGEVNLNEIWIANSYPIPEEARQAIRARLTSPDRIEIIDGPRIETLLIEHMPDVLAEGPAPLLKYFSRFRQFCDAPEQFIVDQLQAKFQLPDVFVPPTSSIALLSVESEATALERGVSHQLRSRAGQSVYLWTVHRDARLHRNLVTAALEQVEKAAGHLARLEVAQKEREVLLGAVHVLRQSHPTVVTVCDPVRLSDQQRASIRVVESSSSDHVKAIQLITDARADDLPSDTYFDLAEDALEKLKKAGIPTNATEIATIRAARHATDEVGLALDRVVRVVFDEYKGLFDKWEAGVRQGAPADESAADLSELSALSEWLLSDVSKSLPALEIGCDPWLVCDCSDLVLILGELGAGKTTFLKRVGARNLTRVVEGGSTAPVPVFVQLASVVPSDDREGALLAAAREQSRALGGTDPPKRLWLLDGLDENRTDLRPWLLQWRDERRTEPVILTSRPSAAMSYFPGFVRLQLRGFDESAILTFIERFPWGAPSESEAFRRVLSDASELMNLARTPLMLTLMAILARRRGVDALPRRRELLYEQIIRLLLGEWDQVKGVQRGDRSPLDVRRLLLAKAAFRLYEARKRYFTAAEFSEVCETPGLVDLNPSGTSALWEDLLRDCVCVPVGRDSFGFVHLSLHEYLAAVELANSIGYHVLTDVLREYARTGWWEEVLVLWAGMKRDIREALLHLSQLLKVSDPVSVTRLPSLLRRWHDVADFTDLRGMRFNPEFVDLLRAAGWKDLRV